MVLYGFFKHVAINFFKIRYSKYFLRVWSDVSDSRATQGCADHLSDIIHFLREERSKLTAFAV